MTDVIRMLTEALNVLRTAPMENAAAISFIEEVRLALFKRTASLPPSHCEAGDK